MKILLYILMVLVVAYSVFYAVIDLKARYNIATMETCVCEGVKK